MTGPHLAHSYKQYERLWTNKLQERLLTRVRSTILLQPGHLDSFSCLATCSSLRVFGSYRFWSQVTPLCHAVLQRRHSCLWQCGHCCFGCRAARSGSTSKMLRQAVFGHCACCSWGISATAASSATCSNTCRDAQLCKRRSQKTRQVYAPLVSYPTVLDRRGHALDCTMSVYDVWSPVKDAHCTWCSQ